MAKFILKSKINSLLKSTGKSPIAEIKFLGTGGAFDSLEKNSSAIIKTASGTILIDCGFTVYPELAAAGILNDIDYVFITHCHEDHIGSLSTLVYHKYFGQKQTVKIECIPSLKSKVKTYLKTVCGHMDDSFSINTNDGILYESLNMIIYKIETTNHHYKGFPSAGFVFNIRKNGEDLFLVFSGDINVPFVEIISEESPALYEALVKVPENVFIFHESTARDYPPYYPHCEYEKLEKIADVFPNIFVYHHSQEETQSVLSKIRKAKMKIDIINRAIDFDLNKKLNLVSSPEGKEKLKVQAKRMKDEFYEDFNIPPLKIQDLNTIGKEFIIQEQMGL